LLGRFRHEDRRREEKCYRPFFDHLFRRGVIAEWHSLPDLFYQEGAGDCMWDMHRNLFWAGYGPRSSAAALDYIQAYFGQDVIGLELITAHYYHLDTCFCPLPGGEVLYYPGAFSPASLGHIAEHVPEHQRIVATAEEAATFCLNAIAFGHDLFMAPPPLRIRSMLMERGYRVHEVDLSSFMLSGGGAYSMTLRLDLCSQAVRRLAA
jgi:N-dimethylarginine dimethylaminohydrolase